MSLAMLFGAIALALCCGLVFLLQRLKRSDAERGRFAGVQSKLAAAASLPARVHVLAQAVDPITQAVRVYVPDSQGKVLQSIATEADPHVRAVVLSGESDDAAAIVKRCYETARPQELGPANLQGPGQHAKRSLTSYMTPVIAAGSVCAVIECEADASRAGELRRLMEWLAPAAAVALRGAQSPANIPEISAPAESRPMPAPSSAIPAPAAEPAGSTLTLMLVDANAATRAELMELLAAKEHRVVPVSAEQAPDLAKRIRFDAVVWTLRNEGWKWSDYQDRLREVIPHFVLVSNAFDAALADSLREGGGFLLSRPVDDSELNRVLAAVAGHVVTRAQ
jgi:CheY-like chemotaxis protein